MDNNTNSSQQDREVAGDEAGDDDEKWSCIAEQDNARISQ